MYYISVRFLQFFSQLEPQSVETASLLINSNISNVPKTRKGEKETKGAEKKRGKGGQRRTFFKSSTQTQSSHPSQSSH